MSLLNQVLQDLEKRNTRIEPTNYNHQVRAVISSAKKSIFLPVLLFAMAVLFIAYSFFKDEQSPRPIQYTQTSIPIPKKAVLANNKAIVITQTPPIKTQTLSPEIKAPQISKVKKC